MNSEIHRIEHLKLEAFYLHRSLFKAEVAFAIVHRYQQAYLHCFQGHHKEKEWIAMEKIVSHQIDVEAVELVLRLKNKRNFLTTRVQILFYLIEVRAAYFNLFVNQESAPIRAIGSLFQSLFRTLYKYLKGLFLVYRYDLL